MIVRAALGWLGLLVLAILNGSVREFLLIPQMGARAGHVTSTLVLAALILAAAWLLHPWLRPPHRRAAWHIGGMWVALTVAFEFLGGHYLFGAPWRDLLAEYDVTRGRIWVLVLGATLVGPVLAHARRPATPGPPPSDTADRPRSVTYGVYAMGAALALGVAILAAGWGYPRIALVTLVVIGGLILGVARRRNWARWTLAFVTVGSLLMTWDIVYFQLTYGIALPLATAAQLALEAVGFVLLFRSAAGRWFRRRDRVGEIA